MKLPIQTLGLMAAGVLIGTALSPVAAQQSGTDGQVALRSDGALYLIQNGQRRWISTATLSDADINAIPEGEPIMTGLALAGSAEAAAKPAAPPPAAASPAAGAGTTGAAPAAAAKPAAGAAPTATTATAGAPKPSDDPNETLSSEIPIEVDLDGSTKIDQGDERKVELKTVKDATCELKVRLVDGTDLTEDSRNADSSGKCKYTIEIPENAKTGGAWLSGAARIGGKVNRQDIAIEITKKK
jgi:hypothetical protein